MCKKFLCFAVFAVVAMTAPVWADSLAGLADVTVVDGAIVSLRYADTEYVVADGDLVLGTTTRWYVLDGVETLWVEGDPAPAATVPGSSDPKVGDVGSKADNFLFTLDGSTNISSIDGINYQETIFPDLTDTFFLFERGGNDAGSWQAILDDGSLGPEVAFVRAADGGPYADTGVSVNGQNAFGVVFTTDVPVMGVRINAPGHDALSISTPKGVDISMEVAFAVTAPVIDGQIDNVWEDASTQSFVPLEDPADGSGTWKVLYDAENLYVMVDITDDSLQNDSASAWQDDSVEIYFDGGNTKLDTPLSGDDHQYTFGWTADDIQGTNIAGYTDGIEQAQVTTATGWRIEVKMPWMSIWGVMPGAGDLIGIDCYYNDDDDGGDSREGKMLSFSAVEGWNDASQWGTALLAADKRIDVTAAGDAVQGVPNDGDWPAGEIPDLAIDDNVETKYLHFKGDFDPDPGTGGTGIQITPAMGPTVVTGLTLTTANDVPGRDPIAFELSGSNDGIDGPYELIASGDIVDFAQEVEWPRFTMNATPISFENEVAYSHYQLVFTAIRGPVGGSVNSMQIAEVELLGIASPVTAPDLAAAFAFGSRALDCATYNDPSVNYTMVLHVNNEPGTIQYDPAKGYGYDVIYPTDSPFGDRAGFGIFGPFDDSANNRNEFPDECPEELYDSFIGAKSFTNEVSAATMGDMDTPSPDPEGIIFRVDVPNGFYRFVGAFGEADNGHAHRILAEDGGSGPPANIGLNHVVLVHNHDQSQYDLNPDMDEPGDAVFARVGFDGLIPPPGDGVAPSPVFVDMDESGRPTDVANSPVLEVTQGYIRIHQLQGNSNDGPGGSRDANGGDIVILELWKVGQ